MGGVPAELEEVPGVGLDAVDVQRPSATVLRHREHQLLIAVEDLRTCSQTPSARFIVHLLWIC